MLVYMSRTKLAFTGHVHNVEFESYLVVMEHRSINIPSIDCNGKYESDQRRTLKCINKRSTAISLQINIRDM